MLGAVANALARLTSPRSLGIVLSRPEHQTQALQGANAQALALASVHTLVACLSVASDARPSFQLVRAHVHTNAH